MKICITCKQEKEESEFYRCSRAKDGLRSACKSCFRAASAAYRTPHHEAVLAKNKAYYATHRATILATRKAYYATHRATVAAHNAAWRAANPDKLRAVNKKYAQTHPEAMAKYSARKTLKRQLGTTPPPELVEVKTLQYLINRQIKERKA